MHWPTQVSTIYGWLTRRGKNKGAKAHPIFFLNVLENEIFKEKKYQ